MKIYTEQGEYEFYLSMKNLMEMLDMKYFVRCHQGYLVNKYKILEQKENHIYLRDKNILIPVSRKFKANVLKVLEENMFS